MSSRRFSSDGDALGGRSWFRTWLLGKGEYAHPVLRWIAMPLFRVGLVLWIVVIVTGAREWSVLWIAAGVLILVSILADVANALVMRLVLGVRILAKGLIRDRLAATATKTAGGRVPPASSSGHAR